MTMSWTVAVVWTMTMTLTPSLSGSLKMRTLEMSLLAKRLRVSSSAVAWLKGWPTAVRMLARTRSRVMLGRPTNCTSIWRTMGPPEAAGINPGGCWAAAGGSHGASGPAATVLGAITSVIAPSPPG